METLGGNIGIVKGWVAYVVEAGVMAWNAENYVAVGAASKAAREMVGAWPACKGATIAASMAELCSARLKAALVL